MTDANEVQVVVGGGGATGGAIARELAASGKRVRAVVHRQAPSFPAGVEVVRGDATDPHRMREVCRGAAVVYNCVMPPFARWTELFPPVMESLIGATADAGAKLVFADDTWMYGEIDGPMKEDLPHRPVSDKGVLRAWLAEIVMHAHARGEVRATIGRGGELYGPAVRSVLGENLFGAALKGRKARWIGNPDVPLTPLYVGDFARGLITLGEREEALGDVWHIPTAEPTTGREFVRTIFEEVGKPPKIGALGSRLVSALGLVWPLAREGADLVYQFEMPFVVDSGKYARTFGGGAATSYREGIRRTIDWYRGEASSADHNAPRPTGAVGDKEMGEACSGAEAPSSTPTSAPRGAEG